MISYNLILPELVDFIPSSAKQLIEQACKRTPSAILGLSDILFRASHSIGDLYVIERDGQVIGITYVIIIEGNYKKSANFVMACGVNFRKWQDDYRGFIRKIITENQCSDAVIIGRKGFERLFPEWQPIGTLYEFKIAR